VAFRGQTGSQSSIVPSMDAFLGVVHASDPLRVFLDELHAYRPVEHRRFIERIRSESSVREKVQAAGRKPLTALYNACVEEVTRFRTRHLEYAASYIHKQSKGAYGNDTDVGTGGTPFMKYLKKHRDEAEAHVLANRL
jgi:indoleamine 2,3-dioxygenase